MSTITKTQPWKSFSRELGAGAVEQTPEEINMQRSYGSHASNTKGRLFTMEDKATPGDATGSLQESTQDSERGGAQNASI